MEPWSERLHTKFPNIGIIYKRHHVTSHHTLQVARLFRYSMTIQSLTLHLTRFRYDLESPTQYAIWPGLYTCLPSVDIRNLLKYFSKKLYVLRCLITEGSINENIIYYRHLSGPWSYNNCKIILLTSSVVPPRQGLAHAVALQLVDALHDEERKHWWALCCVIGERSIFISERTQNMTRVAILLLSSSS